MIMVGFCWGNPHSTEFTLKNLNELRAALHLKCRWIVSALLGERVARPYDLVFVGAIPCGCPNLKYGRFMVVFEMPFGCCPSLGRIKFAPTKHL
jgi:hypothetical protein